MALQLFGFSGSPKIHLSENIWRMKGGVDEQHNIELIKEFTME